MGGLDLHLPHSDQPETGISGVPLGGSRESTAIRQAGDPHERGAQAKSVFLSFSLQCLPVPDTILLESVHIDIYRLQLSRKHTASRGVNWSDSANTTTSSESAVNKENCRETRLCHWSLAREHTLSPERSSVLSHCEGSFIVIADLPTILERETVPTEPGYHRTSSH